VSFLIDFLFFLEGDRLLFAEAVCVGSDTTVGSDFIMLDPLRRGNKPGIKHLAFQVLFLDHLGTLLDQTPMPLHFLPLSFSSIELKIYARRFVPRVIQILREVLLR
jgi:hypothetical protein